MPCPHSNDGGDSGVSRRSRSHDDGDGGVSRRDFVKASVAIGGTAALGACVEATGSPDVPTGDAAAHPDRQHAWNDYLPRDAHGNTVAPFHQVILLFEYAGKGVPTPAERAAVERAMASVDHAYPWGNGGEDPYDPAGRVTKGVFAMLGYSRRYFDRFDRDLPESVALPRPEETLSTLDEDESRADRADAVLLLSSDYGQHLLATEAALLGDLDELNGVEVAGSLVEAFDVADRRTGFIGSGVPRKRLGREEIPEQSPLTMGFKSGFADNQASEDSVTIDDGPFAGGTTFHVSRLSLDLDGWYAHDDAERVHRMFSPDHTTEQVGEAGQFLTDDSGVTEEIAADTEADASERGVVGHTQKVARARTDDFEPRILRRSEAMQTDREGAGFNFSSVQRRIADFVETREQMAGDDLAVEGEDNGIVDHITVLRRGNYLLPPRSKRALPRPDPS